MAQFFAPFSTTDFSDIAKEKCSVVNATLSYYNMQSMLEKKSLELAQSALTYGLCNAMYEAYESNAHDRGEVSDIMLQLVDYWQRAILHLTLADNLIYLIAHVSNDGVTVRKGSEDTTIYKYQQDQLQEQLLEDGNFWLNALLNLVVEGEDAELEPYREVLNGLLDETIQARGIIEGVSGISDNLFYKYHRMEIVAEWKNLLSIHGGLTEDAPLTDTEKRAYTTAVFARIADHGSYYTLPKILRSDLNNEMVKAHQNQIDSTIRGAVANHYKRAAASLYEAAMKERVAAGVPQYKPKYGASMNGGKYVFSV